MATKPPARESGLNHLSNGGVLSHRATLKSSSISNDGSFHEINLPANLGYLHDDGKRKTIYIQMILQIIYRSSINL